MSEDIESMAFLVKRGPVMIGVIPSGNGYSVKVECCDFSTELRPTGIAYIDSLSEASMGIKKALSMCLTKTNEHDPGH